MSRPRTGTRPRGRSGSTNEVEDLLRYQAPQVLGALVRRHGNFHAVRARLLEQSGRPEAAREAYESAAARTLSLPEQRYLQTRAARPANP